MSDIQTLLPFNATPEECGVELALAGALSDIPIPIYDLWNPDTCPVELLPWLAWTFSVDNWEPTWAENVKRAAIRESITIHRRKGTLGAVRRVLAAQGYEAEVTEWFEYAGQQVFGAPHSFLINVDVLGSQSQGVNITFDLLSEIKSIIENVKPVRSYFDLNLTLGIKAPAFVGSFVQIFKRIEAWPIIPEIPAVNVQASIGSFTHIHIRTEVGA